MSIQKFIALFYLLIHIGLGFHQLSYTQNFNSYIDIEQSDSENESLENNFDDIEQDDQAMLTQLWSKAFFDQEEPVLKQFKNITTAFVLPETPPPIV